MWCSVSFLASDRIPSRVQQTGKRTPGIFFGLRNQTKKYMLKNSPSSNFSHPMQLAASLRQVPKDPSGITDPEVWAHVNRTLHLSLLLVPGTNWPEKHHSPPGVAWPSYGAMHIPKNRHASRHSVAAWDSTPSVHQVIKSPILRAQTPSSV